MKTRYHSMALSLLLSIGAVAQPAKKTATPAAPSQAQINKMMIDAMKKQGLSDKEIADALKMIEDAKPMVEQMKNKDIPGSTTSIKMPVKQVQALAAIPTLTGSSAVTAYVGKLATEASTRIPANIKSETDALLTKSSYDKNLPMLLFLKGYVRQSIYASLKLAQQYPADPFVQNNLGFTLLKSGYPEKAIPLFKNMVDQYKDPTSINNLAQSYLALGDVENTRKYLVMGLGISAGHFEMNLCMGFLESATGNSSKATPYIKKALQQGHTPLAEALAEKSNTKLSYDEMKHPPVPELFNPYKIKPVPAVAEWTQVIQAENDRTALHLLKEEWLKKENEASEALSKVSEGKLIGQFAGVATGPFFFKAQYMLKQIVADKAATWKRMEYYQEKADHIWAEFQTAMKNRVYNHDNETRQEECKSKTEIINTYLKKSKENHDAAERTYLPKLYDWINQETFWTHFVIPPDQYPSAYYHAVYLLLEQLEACEKYQQLAPEPSSLQNYCQDFDKPAKDPKKTELDGDPDCPINIKFGATIGDVKYNCQGLELEGGEFFKLTFEKKFNSGEWQVAMGLGGELSWGPFSAGAKGQMFWRLDGLTPIDFGITGEAGVEGKGGPFTIEEKLSGTLGVASVTVDATHLGRQTNIFNMDARK